MRKSVEGRVESAFGNLLHVRFQGDIRQGEMGLVQIGESSLKAEVIEIAGMTAKMQVFEEIHGVQWGSPVTFTEHLLEAELGPGLVGSIFDGLQNPLEQIATEAGLYLRRGLYPAPLNREKTWKYAPIAQPGNSLTAGDLLGTTREGHLLHKITLPLSYRGEYRVIWTAQPGSYRVDEPIATVQDTEGREEQITMVQRWAIKSPLLKGEKVQATEMMETGLRIIDTQFPIVKGGTFCTPGPFGAGKTVLQHHLAKYASVDLVVVTACGERAGEVVEILQTFPQLTDPYNGKPLMDRTVMICNTSSMPVAAREASVYMGVTIAEYYRQMGLDVLLLADSTSRWAQAMREMSGRLEEIPGEEAFPPYLSSRIAAFYERSGVVSLKGGGRGSLTIAGTVSPAGGNFEEPVTQATLAVVGAFLGLSQERADARRYPSIDPLISWSKYIDTVGKYVAQRIPDDRLRSAIIEHFINLTQLVFRKDLTPKGFKEQIEKIDRELSRLIELHRSDSIAKKLESVRDLIEKERQKIEKNLPNKPKLEEYLFVLCVARIAERIEAIQSRTTLARSEWGPLDKLLFTKGFSELPREATSFIKSPKTGQGYFESQNGLARLIQELLETSPPGLRRYHQIVSLCQSVEKECKKTIEKCIEKCIEKYGERFRDTITNPVVNNIPSVPDLLESFVAFLSSEYPFFFSPHAFPPPDWSRHNRITTDLLHRGKEIEKRMEVLGEEGISMEDFSNYLKAELYDSSYLQQNAFDAEDAYCPFARQIDLLELMQLIFDDLQFSFEERDIARNFFLRIQSEIRNMHSLPFASDAYVRAFEKIKEQVIQGGRRRSQ